MRKLLSAFLVWSFLCFPRLSLAQPQAFWDRNVIVTEGAAEVKGRNDSAQISIGVLSEGRNLDLTGSENARKTKAVLSAIKGLGIESLRLETAGYRVNPQKDYDVRPPKIKGYEVYNSIQVTVEGFEPEPLSGHVSSIIGKALESGANNVRHVQFYIKDKKPLEAEALTRATEEALERARILAKAAGVTLKRIASLTTYPTHLPPGPQTFRTTEAMAKADSAAPPIEAGESQIRVEVQVVYEID